MKYQWFLEGPRVAWKGAKARNIEIPLVFGGSKGKMMKNLSVWEGGDGQTLKYHWFLGGPRGKL